MKTRLGFVSNSSSSSFCIYGIQFDSYDEAIQSMKNGKKEFVDSLIKLFNEAYKDDLEQYDVPEVTTLDELITTINDIDLDIWEFFEDILCRDTNISVFTGSEYLDGIVSIGREWKNIGNKETGGEFKKNVRSQLGDYFGKKLNLQTYEESYRC